jgi:hypothetical protein
LPANLSSLTPARKRPRARTRCQASRRVCPTTTLSTARKSRSSPRRARRVRVLLRPPSYKEPSQLSAHLYVSRHEVVLYTC